MFSILNGSNNNDSKKQVNCLDDGVDAAGDYGNNHEYKMMMVMMFMMMQTMIIN